jgi:HEAT repeat protein
MTKRLLLGLITLFTTPVLGLGDEQPLYNNQPISFWMKALQSSEYTARVNAATVLGQIGPAARAAIGALIVAVDDKSMDVRVAALDALGRIGPDAAAAAPKLASFLDHGFPWYDLDLARHAAAALAKVQPSGAGPLVAALVNSSNFTSTDRKPIDARFFERLSASLKDQRSEVKFVAALKGAGQLFTQTYWDTKVDKLADGIDLQLKQIQDNAKDKALEKNLVLEETMAQTQQAIKDYRDQIRIRSDSFKDLLGPDRGQWGQVIKLLSASNDGLRVLGVVVSDYPESEITGIILKEW